MKYKITVELKSQITEEERRNRNSGYDNSVESTQTVLNIVKVVEADTEKQALQKVVNLINDKDIK